MDLMNLLVQKSSLTVPDAMAALEVDRHKARHGLEALVSKGVAIKNKVGTAVVYSPVATVTTDTPPVVAAVLSALRVNKGRTMMTVAQRAKITPDEAIAGLTLGLVLGLVAKSQRRRFVRTA